MFESSDQVLPDSLRVVNVVSLKEIRNDECYFDTSKLYIIKPVQQYQLNVINTCYMQSFLLINY